MEKKPLSLSPASTFAVVGARNELVKEIGLVHAYFLRFFLFILDRKLSQRQKQQWFEYEISLMSKK
jgi:hypothetical protein